MNSALTTVLFVLTLRHGLAQQETCASSGDCVKAVDLATEEMDAGLGLVQMKGVALHGKKVVHDGDDGDDDDDDDDDDGAKWGPGAKHVTYAKEATDAAFAQNATNAKFAEYAGQAEEALMAVNAQNAGMAEWAGNAIYAEEAQTACIVDKKLGDDEEGDGNFYNANDDGAVNDTDVDDTAANQLDAVDKEEDEVCASRDKFVTANDYATNATCVVKASNAFMATSAENAGKAEASKDADKAMAAKNAVEAMYAGKADFAYVAKKSNGIASAEKCESVKAILDLWKAKDGHSMKKDAVFEKPRRKAFKKLQTRANKVAIGGKKDFKAKKHLKKSFPQKLSRKLEAMAEMTTSYGDTYGRRRGCPYPGCGPRRRSQSRFSRRRRSYRRRR